jgi:hypothetical protein
MYDADIQSMDAAAKEQKLDGTSRGKTGFFMTPYNQSLESKEMGQMGIICWVLRK